jgi:hypothetical protein
LLGVSTLYSFTWNSCTNRKSWLWLGIKMLTLRSLVARTGAAEDGQLCVCLGLFTIIGRRRLYGTLVPHPAGKAFAHAKLDSRNDAQAHK